MEYIFYLGLMGLVIYLFKNHKHGMIFFVKWAIVICVGFSLLAWAWVTFDDRKKKNEQEGVTVSVEYNATSKCSHPYSLYVTFKNETKRSVNKISFGFEAYQEGYSDNLVSSSYESSTKILEPKTEYSNCWKAPQLSRDVPTSSIIWSGDVRYVDFQN